MITLPPKFAAENAKSKSEPCVLVKLGSSLLESIQSSQGDWKANTAETQVDYDLFPGSVVISQTAIPDISVTTGTNSRAVASTAVGPPVFYSTLSQEIVNPYSGSVTIDTVTLYCREIGTMSPAIIYCEIWDRATGGTQLSSTQSNSISGSSWKAEVYDFSADNVSFSGGASIYLRMYSATVTSFGDFNSIEVRSAGVGTGTIDHTITLTGIYYNTSGSITSQIIDLGETPAVDGEWKIVDQTPSDYGTTTLTYTAYGSTDNFVTSNVTIGTVVDGDTITSGDWYRYYKLKADFTTTDQSETPLLERMGASFVSYINFQDQITPLGYEPSIKRISSLTTEIDDFELSQIGQLTINIGKTDYIDDYFGTIVVKNKPVKVLMGFNVAGFAETDYIDFYTGVIDTYQLSGRDYSVTIKDNTTSWNFDVPREISTSGKQSSPTYQSDIQASDDHHADVILDILQNYLSVRDSTIDFGSFESVKASSVGWITTRTIAGENAEKASELINQLRILLGAYFIPQANGQIKIKLYDTNEAAVGAISLNDNINRPSYDSKLDDLINKTYVELDFNTSTEVFDAIYIGIDSQSQTDTSEVFTWEFEDYWTDSESSVLDLWTQLPSSDDTVIWWDITYGDKWVAVGDSGSLYNIMYSYNGYDWETAEGIADETWRGVAYGNGRYVAVSESNAVMYSDDGINWLAGVNTVDSLWQSVTYGNGLFVAISNEVGAHEAMYSSDGITWTEAATTVTGQWSVVKYGASLFVAVANTGGVMTSPDGDTWTSRTSAASLAWRGLAWSEDLTLFAASASSGTGNRIMTSPDGITWTSRTSAADNNWAKMVFANGYFVTVGQSGTGDRVMVSSDGVTWATKASAADESWWSIASDGQLFVAMDTIGTNEKLMCGAVDQGSLQQYRLQERLLNRYATEPKEIKQRLDRKTIAWEVGDMVTLTTNQAPSTISAQKYQIKRKNFAPLGNKIDFTFKMVS